MKKRNAVVTVITTVILLVLTGKNQAQDTLLLINGKTKVINNYSLDTSDYKIHYTLLNGKNKSIYASDVFSYTNQKSEETIFYNPSDMGEDVNVQEMKRYINGMSSAWKSYKPKWAALSGFLVGLAAPFVIDVRFSPIIPMAYGIAFGNTLPNNPIFVKTLFERPDDIYYALGYTEVIRKKRTGKALTFGGIGVVLGILARLAVDEME